MSEAETTPGTPPPPDVVRSSDSAQSTRVRKSVEDPGAGGAALFPLRRKILIAMAGVSLLTSALIFVAVQERSVAHLDQEIDARGARLVQTLASIDASYWLLAMYQERPDRRERLEAVAGPDGALRPLKTAPGVTEGILQMSVLDVADDGADRASVQIVDRHLELTDRRQRPFLGPVESTDGLLVGEGASPGLAARSYQLDVPHAGGRLRFFVILSVAHIAAAKRELRTILLLPVGASLLAGIAAAWWVARRITNPVRTLLKDIDQVSAGDLGHRTSAASDDEIGQIARAFNRMTAALKGAHLQELEARTLEHELEIASQIQANLAPRTTPNLPGIEIAAFSRPSKSVGGDYYDYFEIDPTHAGFIVADVAGKGVPGSLVAAMTRAFIRMEAERGRNTSPADTLKRVNRMLAQDIKKGMFVTALYCILDTDTAEVMTACAGHHPLIVWRARSDKVELASPKGIALGLDRGPVFDSHLQEQGVRLEKGDRVVMYTDGAVEAMNAAGEEFGDRRFQELCWRLATGASDRFLAELVRALDAHQGDAPQHDDVTIVTFRYR